VKNEEYQEIEEKEQEEWVVLSETSEIIDSK
jgi:hypothetical protein